MTPTTAPTRVVAVAEPGPTQQQVTAALTNQPEFLLVDVLADMERLARDLRVVDPEIILIDHSVGGQPTLDVIDDLALQFPQVPVVAVLPAEDALAVQQVILAGARAFLVHPFTQVNLLSTLRRVRDLEGRRKHAETAFVPSSAAEEVRPLKTIAVFSPRGGAGCSTVAVNLAVALQEAAQDRVLLLEGKQFFGHLDVMLNLRNRNTLADLVPHANALDAGLIADVVVDHASGVEVLLAPADIQTAQGVRAQDLFNVLTGLQRVYDRIVIDAGSALSENTVTLMDAADRVLLVTGPDLAALHDTSRFIQISRTLAYPAGKVLVVLNRAGLEGGVRTRDVESALHHEVFASIPDDGPNALRSLNRGIPLILKYPRSPASRAYHHLARSLLELGAAQSGQPAAAPTASPNGHRRSLIPVKRQG